MLELSVDDHTVPVSTVEAMHFGTSIYAPPVGDGKILIS